MEEEGGAEAFGGGHGGAEAMVSGSAEDVEKPRGPAQDNLRACHRMERPLPINAILTCAMFRESLSLDVMWRAVAYLPWSIS